MIRNRFLLLQMLPPGEWHCPNCTCKFCGIASEKFENDYAYVYVLHVCNLYEKKCIHFLLFTFDVSLICLYFFGHYFPSLSFYISLGLHLINTFCLHIS